MIPIYITASCTNNTGTVVQHCTKLSKEAKETSFLDIFKTQMDKALSKPTYS